MKAKASNGLLIVMADPEIKDHERVKKAARNCEVNHVFTSVYNGAQLMDLLHKKNVYYSDRPGNPDLVILDIDLPDADGLDALAGIRNDPHLKNIPVYVLTNSANEARREAVVERGATGFFIKPLKDEELFTIISGICNAHFKAAGAK